MKKSLFIRRRDVIFSVVLLGCFCLCCIAEGRDVTMFVTADNHFGYARETTAMNRVNINMMNNLPGTPYPASIGGKVGTPAGVIVAGDLTQGGKPCEWNEFRKHFPLHGGTGPNVIHYDVYECTGNHDRRWKPNWMELQMADYKTVKEEVALRHGDRKYGFDIQGVQFYSLDEYPTESKCKWLGDELASIGKKKPVVLFFHFDMWDDKWWRPAEREHFRQTIDGYNILCILHGHKHNSYIYDWNGYNVFSVGCLKSAGNDHIIGVLKITDTKLIWAEYSHYDSSGNLAPAHWEETCVKSLTEKSGRRRKGVGAK